MRRHAEERLKRSSSARGNQGGERKGEKKTQSRRTTAIWELVGKGNTA